MEEFLKDSPSEFNPSTGRNTGEDNNNYSMRQNMNYHAHEGNSPLILDYAGGFDQPMPTSADDVNIALQDQEFGGSNIYNTLSNDNTVNPSSFTNEPFLDDVDLYGSATQQQQQPQFVNPLSTNLDEIISPPNNQNNTFLNPQYFSPPSRTNNFNSLNAIAEDSLSNSFSNTFSPDISRHGSISVPTDNRYSYTGPDNSGSYLSPQANPQYLSQSANTLDTLEVLKSPYNAPTYINSPSFTGTQASSIPNKTLSPSSLNNMSTSFPNSQSPSGSKDNSSTKQLTKEEKLKRRREFHNAVERRRRDLIKERIKELGLLVPPSMLNPQLCAVQTLQRNSRTNSREINELLSAIKVKETKPNKSTILNKSVDYINHLLYVLDEQAKTKKELLDKIKQLELETQSIADPETAIQQTNQDSYFNPEDFFLDVIGPGNTNNGISTNSNSEFFEGLN